MNGMRVKEMVLTMVSVCFAGGIFILGCSMHHNDEHNYKGAATTSGKVLIIDLADNPEYQPLLVGKPQTCGMRSGRVYLLPGESIGKHSTEAHEEMLVFLLGKGTAIIGEEGTSFEVGQSKICYIPPYTVHNMKNTGKEPFVYIYCVAPITDNGQRQ